MFAIQAISKVFSTLSGVGNVVLYRRRNPYKASLNQIKWFNESVYLQTYLKVFQQVLGPKAINDVNGGIRF